MTTLVYPDGHESFRVDPKYLWIDSGRYSSFPQGTKFRITSGPVLRADSLEVTLTPIAGSLTARSVQMMLGDGWQSRMTTDEALKAVTRFLPVEGFSAITSSVQQSAAAIAEASALRAQQEKAAAENRATEAAARQAAADAAEKARMAELYQTPKVGKPSYDETMQWLKAKFPQLDGECFGCHHELVSTDRCVLEVRASYGVSGPIPLKDAEFADVNNLGGDDPYIEIFTRHHKTSILIYPSGYDTDELAQRIAKALNQAIKLCQPAPVKNNEPF